MLMPRARWQRQWYPQQQQPSQVPEVLCTTVEGSCPSLHCCRGAWGAELTGPPTSGNCLTTWLPLHCQP